MDEQRNNASSQPIRRRRKPTKMQIFQQKYLPLIIAAAAAVMVLVFIIGSVSRSIARRQIEREASIAASSSEAERLHRLGTEADALLAQAADLAQNYDMDGALAALDSFSGDTAEFPEIARQRSEYVTAMQDMLVWDDVSRVMNLSVNMLVADPARAYADSTYGSAYRRNFITIGEFSMMLQQLYDNGYVLVSIRDLVQTQTDADGNTVYTPRKLYLPKDKTPFILTQTGVNYNYYMVDGDGDKLPDKYGAGFACKLVLTDSGEFVCEMVDANGNTSTGAYDLVPILEDFIAKHPDFSIRGARAILAVSGYNGVFGYRIHSEAKDYFGEEAFNAERLTAAALADALQERGYEIACYSYDQTSYPSASIISKDQQRWSSEIVPVIGATDMMVFFKSTDIGGEEYYSGDQYDALYNAGYRFYIGANESNTPWGQLTPDYVRQSRVLVSGNALMTQSQLFTGMFDASVILDPARG